LTIARSRRRWNTSALTRGIGIRFAFGWRNSRRISDGPWPQAQKRFLEWILALEFARDDEARAAGIDGSDLATAVLASLRFRDRPTPSPGATLAGEPSVLKERIARLLSPLADHREAGGPGLRVLWLLAPSLLLAVGLGSAFGERVIGALLRRAA